MAFIAPAVNLSAAYADGGGNTHLILRPKKSPTTGPQHAPANYSYLPVVWLSEDTICFEGTVTLPPVAVTICDEDDNEVLSTILLIEANEESAIDISSLGAGFYILYIVVDEQEFYAEFEL